MSSLSIYTLWASMKCEDEPAPWMIAAEDEHSWEGNPERCDKVFAEAKALAERNDWDVREVVLSVSLEAICAAFLPTRIEAHVEAQNGQKDSL